MPRHTHSTITQNPVAVALVGYGGVLYAAIAVFAVTLFGSTAVDAGHTGYTYPLHHWLIAGGAAAAVVGVLLIGVQVLLADVRRRRTRP